MNSKDKIWLIEENKRTKDTQCRNKNRIYSQKTMCMWKKTQPALITLININMKLGILILYEAKKFKVINLSFKLITNSTWQLIKNSVTIQKYKTSTQSEIVQAQTIMLRCLLQWLTILGRIELADHKQWKCLKKKLKEQIILQMISLRPISTWQINYNFKKSFKIVKIIV